MAQAIPCPDSRSAFTTLTLSLHTGRNFGRGSSSKLREPSAEAGLVVGECPSIDGGGRGPCVRLGRQPALTSRIAFSALADRHRHPARAPPTLAPARRRRNTGKTLKGSAPRWARQAGPHPLAWLSLALRSWVDSGALVGIPGPRHPRWLRLNVTQATSTGY